MEPKLPRPNMSPEVQSTAPNLQPELPSRLPEVLPEKHEAHEQTVNKISDDSALAAATQAVPILPAPAIPSQTTPQPSTDDKTVHLAANDEDRIEKEWVDKAKKVVAETREDPHKQSYEVSKMQTDYLSKRFGKQINLPNDS